MIPPRLRRPEFPRSIPTRAARRRCVSNSTNTVPTRAVRPVMRRSIRRVSPWRALIRSAASASVTGRMEKATIRPRKGRRPGGSPTSWDRRWMIRARCRMAAPLPDLPSSTPSSRPTRRRWRAPLSPISRATRRVPRSATPIARRSGGSWRRRRRRAMDCAR